MLRTVSLPVPEGDDTVCESPVDIAVILGSLVHAGQPEVTDLQLALLSTPHMLMFKHSKAKAVTGSTCGAADCRTGPHNVDSKGFAAVPVGKIVSGARRS